MDKIKKQERYVLRKEKRSGCYGLDGARWQRVLVQQVN